MSAEEKRKWLGLLRYRQCLVPTAWGWAVVLLGCGVLLAGALYGVCPFLAVNDPRPGGVLVVEGWEPDFALKEAVTEFRRNHYEKLYVTGGPIEMGAPLSEYKTYADLGAATMLSLGLSTNQVQAVPAPFVPQDRTYTSAVFLGKWFHEHGLGVTNLNLLTLGPHARRSRLLFEKALGKGVIVGVISLPSRDYEPGRWWRSSQGVRMVIGEALAYAYARVIFRAPNQD
ncbi:conserved hypothetical protein [Verrucomicrobia bacterium]|nr:conserved hypothetical protein [Verrucomicrobiota bacterium]